MKLTWFEFDFRRVLAYFSDNDTIHTIDMYILKNKHTFGMYNIKNKHTNSMYDRILITYIEYAIFKI